MHALAKKDGILAEKTAENVPSKSGESNSTALGEAERSYI